MTKRTKIAIIARTAMKIGSILTLLFVLWVDKHHFAAEPMLWLWIWTVMILPPVSFSEFNLAKKDLKKRLAARNMFFLHESWFLIAKIC